MAGAVVGGLAVIALLGFVFYKCKIRERNAAATATAAYDPYVGKVPKRSINAEFETPGAPNSVPSEPVGGRLNAEA